MRSILIIIPPVTVEVGPVRHSKPSNSTMLSPAGQQLSRTTSATSINFLPDECAGTDCSQCVREHIPITGSPRFSRHRHLDNHGTNAARRNHDHRIVCAKLESFQNFFGIAFVFFQMQRRAQSISANDIRVVRHREFDHRYEADKAALTRRHLFAHHPRMTVAKEKDQDLYSQYCSRKFVRRVRCGRVAFL